MYMYTYLFVWHMVIKNKIVPIYMYLILIELEIDSSCEVERSSRASEVANKLKLCSKHPLFQVDFPSSCNAVHKLVSKHKINRCNRNMNCILFMSIFARSGRAYQVGLQGVT